MTAVCRIVILKTCFRLLKERKKADRLVLESQEKAFWRIQRPVVGQRPVMISYFVWGLPSWKGIILIIALHNALEETFILRDIHEKGHNLLGGTFIRRDIY